MAIRRVVRTISSGSFGRVELVELDDGTNAARKVFDPSPAVLASADEGKLRQRFAREVRVQSVLPKDVFVPILAHDLKAEPPWFLMPLCDRTLQQEIDDHRRAHSVPTDALLHVLDSLEFLEAHDMVHRDLKPSNVLLHEGRWKLADLGLISFPATDATKLTSTLSAWGTEPYCAPEQRMSFSECSWTADQYSFGCILHDIEVGRARVPYQTHSSPGRLGRIIELCTHSEPAHRFRSVKGLRGALISALDGPPIEQISTAAQEIKAALENIENMTDQQLQALGMFLTSEQSAEDLWAVLTSAEEDTLSALYARNRQIFDSFVRRYLEWTKGHFGFAYCDVIAGCLDRIFSLGSISQKSATAIHAARLAESHNRWYVMGRVMEMCGPNLSDEVARRIAIDIRALEAERDFLRCANGGNRDVGQYHPLIAHALMQATEPPP